MSDQIETNRDEGGNTINPPQSKKPIQSVQSKHLCFTFNNYDRDEIIILQKVFSELCFMYAFQEETGPGTEECPNGTPHLQGVISLHKRARWSEFGLSKKIHWEKTIDVKASYLYCTKISTRTGEIFLKNYTVPKVLQLCIPDKPWQLEILDLIKSTPDNRKVYWYWSVAGGLGKSQFCKYLLAKHNCVFIDEGKKGDIMNCVYNQDMDRDNVIVVFDVPRENGNKVSYKSIESIKNGMIFNSKYETGYKLFNSPHVVVFANEPPDKKCLSTDRWVIKQLDSWKSRFNTCLIDILSARIL